MIQKHTSSSERFKNIWEEYRAGRHVLELNQELLLDDRLWYEANDGKFIISVFQSGPPDEEGYYFFAVWKMMKAYGSDNALIQLQHESLDKVFEFAQLWYLWYLAGEVLGNASFKKKLN